jgi:hypothetical protein
MRKNGLARQHYLESLFELCDGGKGVKRQIANAEILDSTSQASNVLGKEDSKASHMEMHLGVKQISSIMSQTE